MAHVTNFLGLLEQLQSADITVHQGRCAVVRNRNATCMKCADVCTSGCISYDDNELVIEPERCIGCGTCARACPLDNIRMVDGRPVWGGSCTHCMACIDVCPSKAIEFKDKTVGRSRYWNPSYSVRHDAARPSEG